MGRDSKASPRNMSRMTRFRHWLPSSPWRRKGLKEGEEMSSGEREEAAPGGDFERGGGVTDPAERLRFSEGDPDAAPSLEEVSPSPAGNTSTAIRSSGVSEGAEAERAKA